MARFAGQNFVDMFQGAIVLHLEHVTWIRGAGNGPQLCLVHALSHPNGEEFDAFASGHRGLQAGLVGVVRVAVRDQYGDVGCPRSATFLGLKEMNGWK